MTVGDNGGAEPLRFAKPLTAASKEVGMRRFGKHGYITTNNTVPNEAIKKRGKNAPNLKVPIRAQQAYMVIFKDINKCKF